MEAILHLLGYSQVYTNLDFEMISMTVMVERPRYDQIAPSTSDNIVMSSWGPADLIPVNHIISVTVCDLLLLPPWQKLTHSKKMLLLDNLYSPVTVDKTTMFSVRPPQLHFIKNQACITNGFSEILVPGGESQLLQCKLRQFSLV
jgi:hypothetical protein